MDEADRILNMDFEEEVSNEEILYKNQESFLNIISYVTDSSVIFWAHFMIFLILDFHF